MISRQIIKQNAKAQMGRNIFGNTWLMLLLSFFVGSALLSVSGSVPFAPVIIAGPIAYGLTSIVLSVTRGNPTVEISQLFSGFSEDFGRNFLIGFLRSLFIFFWSLLFVIPGIVKSYSYSLAFFVAKDHPEYDWSACIKESQRLTAGHKWDLFVLDISFIGWYFVGSLCLGIGTLWVIPYHKMAIANYYEALLLLDGGSAVYQ